MSFDPGNLAPLEGLGTVYPNIRVVDEWSVLNVTRGCALMNKTHRGIVVSAPTDPALRPGRGDGWTFELNDGWTLAPVPRVGDFVLNRK